MKGLLSVFNRIIKSEKGVFFILFLYGFFVRLPFFFRDYVDRDESTFILVGQSWVDGHLPFTMLWDVKPPLNFLFFAIPIYLFGKSFIAIRFLGVLFISFSSFYTYKFALENTNRKTAVVIGLFAVSLQSMFGSLQGVMSEHIAIAFLVPALYLLSKKESSTINFLASGMVMGVALMVKLNIAYVALFIGLAIIYLEYKKNKSFSSLYRPILYGIGILVIILATYIPYYINDLGLLWWKSVIKAPLAYAGARQYSTVKLLLYLLPFFGILLFGWQKKIFNIKNRSVLILMIAVIGTLVAFIKGGRVNGHYLVLIYPFILPLVALMVSKLVKVNFAKIGLVVGLLFLLLPMESYKEYFDVVTHKIEKGTFFNGEGISIPQYFTENNLSKENVLFMEYHIGYWVMGINPPTKSTVQPSNVLKDEMFFAYDNPRKTAEEELKYLLEVKKPDFIITRKNRRIFDKSKLLENFYMNLQLLKNYTVLDTVEKAVIYKRLEFQ